MLGRHRFVGNFIHPIIPGRELNGPRYAARFVALIPFKREISLSGGRINRWHSNLATLCRLEGDVEDHAVLLCSLLLGWGLNAYVALGTDLLIYILCFLFYFCFKIYNSFSDIIYDLFKVKNFIFKLINYIY